MLFWTRFIRKDSTLPIKLQANVSLKEFTTFKIGGLAKYFTCVKTLQEVFSALQFANNNKLEFLILGKGSNVLIDSKGFNGLVILNKIGGLKINGNLVTVGSGYKYPLLAYKLLQLGLTGLEFAAGIPATVGGAIFMNAGANGYQTSDVLEEILFLNAEKKLVTLKKSELGFSYRRSILQDRKGIVLEATFNLKPMKNGRQLQKDLTDYRVKTQPYSSYSAGCIFQNPREDISAAYLIDKCGLKNKRIGGAVVSEKHANFIINDKDASSDDVIMLIDHIKTKVQKETGYLLKQEVRYIPYGK